MNMNMEDDGDHSGSSSGSSMVSFEIALQGGDETTTWETCLLDKSNPYYYHADDDNDDDDIIDDALIRRKYPWRRFKAFLKSSSRTTSNSSNNKGVCWMLTILLVVTLAVLASSSSRRQRQQQQQVQSVNFAGQRRHVIEHDYFASTDREYVSDYAPISHKCLFGDACTCADDFNPREASQDWYNAHEANSKAVASPIIENQQQQQYDVIFVGDDLMELWAGNNGNRTTTSTTRPRPNGSTNDDHHYALHQYFQQSFTKDGGGDVNGLALGIAGDTTSVLRWRLKNGELPPQAQAKIWWLSIGANDLDVTRSGCSEEATLLGIVRAAQDIMYHKKHADGSVHVVIQALLPVRVVASAATAAASLPSQRTTQDEKSNKRSNRFSSLFPRKKKNLEIINDDDDSKLVALLLPSIQNINKQLAIFCQQHENVVFFDPSAFLDSGTTPHQNQNVANKAYLSLEGYKVLGDAIHNEVLRIIRYEK